MNKNKIVMASIGGVCLLASLALAYLAYEQMDETCTMREDLESTRESIEKSIKAAVKPTAAAVEAVEANRKAYEEWTAEAKRLAGRGDKQFAPTTDAAFKTFMLNEAKRMSAFAGGNNGKLVKEDFDFGFKKFIVEGAMPQAAELPTLQRQWDDVTTVVTALAEAGIYELVSLVLKDDGAPAPEAAQADTGRGNRRRGGGQNRGAKAAEAEEKPYDVTAMEVRFTTRPSGLVKALNTLAKSERFCVVENFQFKRTKDDLREALGESKNAADGSAGARVGRRGRRAAAETEESGGEDDSAKKGTLVTDPSTASLLEASMTVKVFDFRTKKEEVKE